MNKINGFLFFFYLIIVILKIILNNILIIFYVSFFSLITLFFLHIPIYYKKKPPPFLIKDFSNKQVEWAEKLNKLKGREVTLFKISFLIFIWLMITFSPNLVGATFVIIGMVVISVGFFLFINLIPKQGNLLSIQFRTLSENAIKILLMILMSITTFIPPISNPSTIIIWDQISILNYIRGFIFLIGLAFLPGANLYNIFFPNDNLAKKLNIVPFILKITIYPILSFGFIGIVVLILDQMNLNREMITLILFLLILGLFFSDIIKERIKGNTIKFRSEKIKISRNTLIILILMLGVVLISLGIYLSATYLIYMDNLAGIYPAYYIGRSNLTPIYDRNFQINYPIFWGYTTFGLSVLCGIPFFNINTMLTVFCYLYISSIYLLNKSLLNNYKEKYIILSTFLMISVFDVIFQYIFSYKSYAFSLLFVSLALFFSLINDFQKDIKLKQKQKMITENRKYLILGSFFLVLSYATYFLPFFIGLLFMFLYCLFFKNKNIQYSLKVFSYFILLSCTFLILFDLLMDFYLGYILKVRILVYFRFEALTQLFIILPVQCFMFLMLIGIYFPIVIIYYLFTYFSKNRKKSIFKFKINSKKLFLPLLILFFIFFIIDVYIQLELRLFDVNFTEDNYLFLFLTLFFESGLIVFLGISFSYYSYKKDKKIFNILLSWIIILIFLSPILLIKEWIINFGIVPQYNLDVGYMKMKILFSRVWLYSNVPLSIFASIGLFKFIKKIKNHKISIKIKNFKWILKSVSFSILILFLFDGFVKTATKLSDPNNHISENGVQMISWMSENIPLNSKIIIVHKQYLIYGVMTMTFSTKEYLEVIFSEGIYNQTEFNDKINYLKAEGFQYLLTDQKFVSRYPNGTLFINKFYNKTLYICGNLNLYFAPYFN